MGRAIRNTITGLALAGALTGTASCGALEAAFAPSEVSFAQPTDRDFIKTTFDKTADFGGKHGVGLAKGAQLIMLSETETHKCGGMDWTSATRTIGHCASENSIVVPAAAINDIRDRGNFKGGTEGILGHELGHTIQAGKPDVSKNAPSGKKELFDELQATCYSAITMFTIDAASTAEARREFQATEYTEDHGSAAAQVAIYDQGYAAAAAGKDPFAACATVPGI
jgi:hypothetical protein